MADDNTVTEHQDTEDENSSTDEVNFSDAFNDAVVGDDGTETDTTDADIEAAEAKAAEDAESDQQKLADNEGKNASADDKTSEDGKDGDDKKSDDDSLSEEDKVALDRGKAIIKGETEAKEEADKQAEEEKQRLAEEEAAKEADKVNPLTEDRVKTFVGMIAPSELPDTIELDGVDYDVKSYMADNPEAQVISGMVTQKILERLVENGVVMTAAQHNEKMQDIEDRLYGLHFDTTVMRAIPDAMQIVETKEYQTWMEKEATKEDLALLGSADPADYILGLNRFPGAATASDKSKVSDKSNDEAKAKAKADKDKHDSIHSSTMSASHKTDTKGSMESGKSEFSNAFAEAEADAEKKK